MTTQNRTQLSEQEGAGKPAFGSVLRRRLGGLRRLLAVQELGVVVAGVVVLLVFTSLSENFLTSNSFASIMGTAVQFGVVGLGVTVLLVAGEFDLSVGAVYAMGPMVTAWLIVEQGTPVWIGVLAGIAVSGGIGLINALLVVYLNIHSFIITLATGMFVTGAALNMTGGYGISYFEPSGLLMVLGQGKLFGSNYDFSLLWFIGFGVVLTVILNWTKLGNWLMATGGDARSARGMGVPVRGVKIFAFTLSGALAGLTGILQFAALGTATPTQGGRLGLTALAVAVVGGAVLTGGRGSILGSMLSAVVLGMAYSGLIMAGVSSTWFSSLVGFVLLFAVVINTVTARVKTRGGIIDY